MDIRLYFDEDSMHHGLVAALRSRGADVLTAFESGMSRADDEDQLTFARSEQRVVYTFNVGDFCDIHSRWLAAGDSHFGIIIAPQQRMSVGEQLRRLLEQMAALSAGEMNDRLEFLSNWSPSRN